MNATAVLIPFPSQDESDRFRRLNLPDDMTQKERDDLIFELGKISAELAGVRARDEEQAKSADQRFRAIQEAADQRFRGVDARLAKLERGAVDSGEWTITQLQKSIEKKDQQLDKWKWWVLSIVATLVTSAIVGTIVHFLSR